MQIEAGTQFASYEILGSLGAGGMGEVYRAHDPRIGRDVAIKILRAATAADPDRLHRFQQEAHAAGILNHPEVPAKLLRFDLGKESATVVRELPRGELGIVAVRITPDGRYYAYTFFSDESQLYLMQGANR